MSSADTARPWEGGASPDESREQRYEALADFIPQIVWAASAAGDLFYYNRRWYEYTGLSPAESEGEGFARAIHPDDLDATLAQWRRSWQQGLGYEIEHRMRRFDGAYQWFISRAVPVRSAAGRVSEWVGTSTNIDEQRRTSDGMRFLADAGALLSASLDYETTLAQLAHLAVPQIADWCAVDLAEGEGVRRLAVAHRDERKVALAHELQRRVPYEPRGMTGVPAVIRSGRPELIPWITREMVLQSVPDPDLRALVLELGLTSSMIVPLRVREQTIGALSLVSAESGRRFTAADLSLAEELAARAASAIENAGLYRELQQFRATLDQTHDCVFMCDPDTLRFVYVNQGAIDQVGYSAEELLRMTPLDIKPAFSEESYRALIAPLVQGRQAMHTFETVHRHRDGHDIPVEVGLQHIVLPAGGGRLVAIVRDISERKRAELELRDRTEQLARTTASLRERNRELDQFAYVASHDLKAPLRGIANLAQWIEEDIGAVASDEIRGQLELLRGRVRRMEELINGLLRYSRIGRTAGTVTTFAVSELLDDVLDMLSPPERVAVAVAPDMPTLRADRLLLQQVFANLIGNAVKHSGERRLQVAVGVERDGEGWRFSIADDGPGIAPEYHERIFGIFQTLASRDQVEGSGLGLALVRKIVEHHGGKVWVESAEGRGATFRFTWPDQPIR